MISVIIPARGGSKGLPKKNIKFFLGKPLIVHTIEYALESSLINEVVVSTDDDEISKISIDAGAKVIKRPYEYSTDKSTTENVISHFLCNSKNKPTIIVLLQPTSPIRPKNSLDEALKYFNKEKYDSLLSLSPSHRFFWQLKNKKLYAKYDYLNRPRRQDINKNDKLFIENGSLYIFTYENFNKEQNRLGGNIGYIEWSEEFSIEIDTPLDFMIAEKLLNKIRLKN